MSEVDLNQKKAIEEAKAAGMKVYRGRPNRLLLDLDDEYALFLYEQRFPIVVKILSDAAPEVRLVLREVRRWKSRSGHGWHVLIVSTRDLEVMERFLLQAILGSDYLREVYSLLRLWDGQEEPSMLFRPPDVSKPGEEENFVRVHNLSEQKRRSSFRHKPVTITDDDVPF